MSYISSNLSYVINYILHLNPAHKLHCANNSHKLACFSFKVIINIKYSLHYNFYLLHVTTQHYYTNHLHPHQSLPDLDAVSGRSGTAVQVIPEFSYCLLSTHQHHTSIHISIGAFFPKSFSQTPLFKAFCFVFFVDIVNFKFKSWLTKMKIKGTLFVIFILVVIL